MAQLPVKLLHALIVASARLAPLASPVLLKPLRAIGTQNISASMAVAKMRRAAVVVARKVTGIITASPRWSTLWKAAVGNLVKGLGIRSKSLSFNDLHGEPRLSP